MLGRQESKQVFSGVIMVTMKIEGIHTQSAKPYFVLTAMTHREDDIHS